MKTISAIFYLLSAILVSFGGATYPWVYYGQDLDGSPLTNAITIEAWPQTNTITAVSTNLVTSFSKTYYPTNPAGYYSNNLAPGNYRLTIAGQTRGVTFGIVAAGTNQNLAQVANVPAPQFMNFTIAQFSDAGTAAYSNAVAFVLNNNSAVLAALGYTPATNAPAWSTASNPTNQYTVNVLYTNTTPRSLLLGSASGSYLRYTNNGIGYALPVTNNFCVPLATNATFKFDNAGTLTNTVLWY